MDVGQEDNSDWQPFQPETLVQGLRCPVCLEYFVRPHTLICGHTFCLRCLRTLARLTRHSRERTPIERLRFRCPSCRKLNAARPIIRRRAAINYAIKELVDEWFQSPYSSGSVQSIFLRSVASQTRKETGGEQSTSPSSSAEEILNKGISSEEFREVLFHKIPPKKEHLKDDIFKIKTNTSASNDDLSFSEDNGHTSTDDDSSDGERFNLQVLQDPQIRTLRMFRSNTFSVASALRMMFEESRVLFNGIRQSRSRMALTFCWFLYGVAVVYISRAFLPWMCFYTMIYFIILYAELSQPAFFRS